MGGPNRCFDRGIDLLYRGQVEQAIEQFKRSLQITPDHLETFTRLGICFATLKQHEEAVKWFEKAVKISPEDSDLLYNVGLSLKKLEKYYEALEFINRSIELQPTNLDNAYILKGNILRELGNDNKAIKCYDNALNINPHSSLARENKITSLKNLERFEEITKTQEEGKILNKVDFQSLFLEGENKLNSGLFNEAIDYFDKALALNPNFHAARNYKSIALAKLQENRGSDIIKIDSKKYDALIEKGMHLIKIGEYEIGLDCLFEARKINPNSADICNRIGDVYFYFKDYINASKWYENALAIDINNQDAYLQFLLTRGILNNIMNPVDSQLFSKQEMEILKKERKRAIKAYNIGKKLFKKKQYNQALGYLNEAINLLPNFTNALLTKGLISIELERYSEALTSFDELLKYEPNHQIANDYRKLLVEELISNEKETEQVHKNREIRNKVDDSKIEGVEKALQLLKDIEKIISEIDSEITKKNLIELFDEKFKSTDKYKQIEFLDELAKACPNNKFVWFLLKEKHLDVKNLGQAIVYAKKIIKLDQHDEIALNHLGWMHTMAAKFNEAKEYLERAIAINPQNKNILRNFSLLYEVLGEKEKAIDYVKKYIQLDPEDKGARTKLETLLNNQSEFLGIKKKILKSLSWGYNIKDTRLETVQNGITVVRTVPIREEEDYKDIDVTNLRLTEFRKAVIPEQEAYILRNIENLTGEKFILSLSSYYGQKLSFTIFKNRIIQLSFYKVNLDYIPENIKDLESLRSISISRTNIRSLPESIGELEYLENLDVSFNDMFTSIPNSIGKLKNLKRLSFGHNNLSEIPDSIGNLDSLTSFNITLNKIKKIPDSIGKLKSIKYIDFQGNQLETLPESIGNLSTLKSLTLFNNQLKILPESIGNLKSLKVLSTGTNNLSSIPSSIGNLKKLKRISLEENPIRSLPKSLLNIQTLKGVTLEKYIILNHLDAGSKIIIQQLEQKGVKINA